MNFYNDSDNVDSYIKMCENYDGSNIYEAIEKHLEPGRSVLELGSGAGFDISYLRDHYHVTGSDLSDEFLKRCRAKHPDVEFLKIDVRDINVPEKYDCIFSNKVLHHLTESELSESLNGQAKALSPHGIIAHSFWIGEESLEMNGMLFTYYRKEHLLNKIAEHFTILSTMSYQEFEASDSLFVIAQLKPTP